MMDVQQVRWSAKSGWLPTEPQALPQALADRAQLVLLFGSRQALADRDLLATLRSAYPQAQLLGCSTAGEIHGTEVLDGGLVATAIAFETTRITTVETEITDGTDSYGAGYRLARLLEPEGLVHVFLLSDGLNINGSQLVSGVIAGLPETVAVTGGLAGDGADFAETLVLATGEARSHLVAAIGFYGDRLRVGYGSWGGWDPFGPERLVTKSDGNRLYGLDGRSALDLYQEYLGDYAAGLPATGLLFPLSLRERDTQPDEAGLTRTILAIDQEKRGLVFAGNVPEGSTVQLMKANIDRLVEGAETAAETAVKMHDSTDQASDNGGSSLAICISCVGRKLVLKQRIEEEVEAVQDIMGDQTLLTGFYSYGEIAPFQAGAPCRLHNQTMTITTLSELPSS